MKIFNGDAIELIKEIEDKTIDLIILDPNYQDWDDLLEKGLLKEAVRVCKEEGNIICFTKQPFDYNLRIAVNPYFKRELIWTFAGPAGAWVSNKLPLVSFQKLFWLTLSKDYYINVRTGRDYKNDTKSTKRASYMFEGYHKEGKYFQKSEEGTWIRDHYHFNKSRTGKIPSKPKELIEILVRCFSKDNGTVLDAFFGSGVIADVCKELNREYIGFELDKSLFDIYQKKQNC